MRCWMIPEILSGWAAGAARCSKAITRRPFTRGLFLNSQPRFITLPLLVLIVWLTAAALSLVNGWEKLSIQHPSRMRPARFWPQPATNEIQEPHVQFEADRIFLQKMGRQLPAGGDRSVCGGGFPVEKEPSPINTQSLPGYCREILILIRSQAICPF